MLINVNAQRGIEQRDFILLELERLSPEGMGKNCINPCLSKYCAEWGVSDRSFYYQLRMLYDTGLIKRVKVGNAFVYYCGGHLNETETD